MFQCLKEPDNELWLSIVNVIIFIFYNRLKELQLFERFIEI